MTTRCLTCKRELDVDYDPLSINCGGDCIACMAVSDDPSCVEYVRRIAREQPEVELPKSLQYLKEKS